MNDGPFRRYVFVAEHPRHEGTVSVSFLSGGGEAVANRRAIVHFLRYFRDDDFRVFGPLVIRLDATEKDIDLAVIMMTDNPNLAEITREEAFGE